MADPTKKEVTFSYKGKIITAVVPIGATIQEVQAEYDEFSAQQPQLGPIAVADPEVRQEFGEAVEKQPFLKRMAIQSAGPLGGAAIGARLGSPFGLPGLVIGTGLGALGGTILSQETGISPTNEILCLN